MLHDKELIENNNIRSEMLLDGVAEMLRLKFSNVTGILTQPLNPMDITDEKVIEIVADSLKTLTTSVESRNCGKNDRKLLSISQDIIITLCSKNSKRMPKQLGLGISLRNS